MYNLCPSLIHSYMICVVRRWTLKMVDTEIRRRHSLPLPGFAVSGSKHTGKQIITAKCLLSLDKALGAWR